MASPPPIPGSTSGPSSSPPWPTSPRTWSWPRPPVGKECGASPYNCDCRSLEPRLSSPAPRQGLERKVVAPLELIIERIGELRAYLDAARGKGRTVGFVPTMGAFHEGHRSLMRAARAHHDVVVVSLFVNPLQFGPTEDLARYPKDLAGDLAAAAAEGVDIVFAPP